MVMAPPKKCGHAEAFATSSHAAPNESGALETAEIRHEKPLNHAAAVSRRFLNHDEPPKGDHGKP
jgi:hypothetical protein